jgi:hypothetical protein
MLTRTLLLVSFVGTRLISGYFYYPENTKTLIQYMDKTMIGKISFF